MGLGFWRRWASELPVLARLNELRAEELEDPRLGLLSRWFWASFRFLRRAGRGGGGGLHWTCDQVKLTGCWKATFYVSFGEVTGGPGSTSMVVGKRVLRTRLKEQLDVCQKVCLVYGVW